MALMGDGVPGTVAAPERRGAADGFKIDPPAAARAVVDNQAGVLFDKRVPKRVEPFDVPHFGDALAVRCISGLPKTERIDIEVLPIAAEAKLVDSIGNEFCEELSGGRVAEIQQGVVAAIAEKPIAVVLVPRRAFEHALGLKPKHEFAAGFAQRRAERFETIGVEVLFDPPVTDVGGPATVAKPFGVDPVVFDWQFVGDDLPDVVEMDFGAGGATQLPQVIGTISGLPLRCGRWWARINCRSKFWPRQRSPW